MFKSIAAAVLGLSLSLGVWAKTEATQELPPEIKALRWQESGGRTRTEPDLSEWVGKRATAGRMAPRGFPRDNKFN